MTITIHLSADKFNRIDFDAFKIVKRHTISHHDIPILAMMNMPYRERKDVKSGVYYKDGYLIEVINFRGRASVVCTQLKKAQIDIYESKSAAQ